MFLHIRFAPNADAHMAMHVLRYVFPIVSYVSMRSFGCVDVGESGRTFRMFLCVRLWTSRREPRETTRESDRGDVHEVSFRAIRSAYR